MTASPRRRGIRNYFVPDRHYGSYRIDDIAEVAAGYLANLPARTRIAEAARAEVLRAHTNTSRAAEIHGDFGLAPRRELAGSAELHEATRAAQESFDAAASLTTPA